LAHFSEAGGVGGLSEDKKAREELLALNQVLARQVMEKSRMVAGKIHTKFLNIPDKILFFLFHGKSILFQLRHILTEFTSISSVRSFLILP
jgi:hypothetical protein